DDVVSCVDGHGAVRLQSGRPPQHRDVEAFQIAADLLTHRLGDLGSPSTEPLQCEVRGQLEAETVHLAASKSGQIQRSLTQRLGGDPATVDRCPAQPGSFVDDGDALAEVGSQRRRLLSGRTGAYDQEVETLPDRKS